MIQATIIIPTYNHGPLLRHALASALAQTVKNIEIFIIGDGVSAKNRKYIQTLLATDPRITFVDKPKSPRHGEPYRHEVLQKAHGKIVCYLADDDLWLPDHVEYMLKLLKNADFAHSLPLYITPKGIAQILTGDFKIPFFREYILRGDNFIHLSHAAHTLSFYRQLPYGWATTPKGIYSDSYMWQQFLSVKDCRLISGTRPTVLVFPSPQRINWTLEKRDKELNVWSKAMQRPNFNKDLLLQILPDLLTDRARLFAETDMQLQAFPQQQQTITELQNVVQNLNNQLARIKSTITWRLHSFLLDKLYLKTILMKLTKRA